jgi:sialic acid synthase SpsE
MKTFIIAEAGVNHNGSLDMAKALIDVAVDSGADAVKFQTFRAENLVTEAAPKANYQLQQTETSESQFTMLKKLELNLEHHLELIAYAQQKKMQFLSTPFDLESLKLLTEKCDIPLIKIASGEITNSPLLLAAARTGKPIILSTGMANLGDIEVALGVLAFGYLNKNENSPTSQQLTDAYRSTSGQAILQNSVTLLHCTTEYPAPYADVNLKAMDTMRLSVIPTIPPVLKSPSRQSPAARP